MLKVLAAVLAVLSVVISITLYSTTIPAVQKQGADNAAAIIENQTYIKTVDDALENLQEAFDVLEEKKIFQHNIGINTLNSTDNEDKVFINLSIWNNDSDEITHYSDLVNILFSLGIDSVTKAINCSGYFYNSNTNTYYYLRAIYSNNGSLFGSVAHSVASDFDIEINFSSDFLDTVIQLL